jgi:hypothetical protein
MQIENVQVLYTAEILKDGTIKGVQCSTALYFKLLVKGFGTS